MFLRKAVNQTVYTMAATVSSTGACMHIRLYVYMLHYTCTHMPKNTFARTTK